MRRSSGLFYVYRKENRDIKLQLLKIKVNYINKKKYIILKPLPDFQIKRKVILKLLWIKQK